MKKVCILGTNGLPANYGGFETLAHHLTLHLSKEYNITVYCSKTPKKKQLHHYLGARLVYFPFKANGWQSLIYDFTTILHALFFSDTLIILGFSGAFAFPLNIFFKKNIIFNIGGIEWKKVRGRKFTSSLEIKLKKIMESISVKNASTVIIDNISFKEYLENRYNIRPVLAEYGGDHAQTSNINEDLLLKYPFLEEQYDLTVSRAQEDMNIHLVIDAYKKVKTRKVVIISNWGITNYGRELYYNNYGKHDNIILLNAIYDIDILNAIRSHCSIYLHTHSLCGTAPSLVEAMYLGNAVISFDVDTNIATTENKSLYFRDTKSLIEIVNNIDQKKINSIREEMNKIAHERYTWNRIVKIYKNNI